MKKNLCNAQSVLVSVAWMVSIAMASVASGQEVLDHWSSKVLLLDSASEDFLAPVHATLLPDGKVMLIGFAQSTEEPNTVASRTGTMTAILIPPPLGQEVPPSLALSRYDEIRDYDSNPGSYCQPENATITCIQDTFFCCGHTLQADGLLLVVGGLRTLNNWPDTSFNPTLILSGAGGPDYSSIWNPETLQWVRVGTQFGVGGSFAGVGEAGQYGTYFLGTERYYATATMLANSTILVAAGAQILGLNGPGGSKNLSVEVYDPNASPSLRYVEISKTDESPPEIFNPDYTHTFLLPTSVQGQGTFDVMMVGEAGEPQFLDSTGGSPLWSPVAGPKRPGNPEVFNPNDGASTVMLPIRVSQQGYANGSILVAGGESSYSESADVYEPGLPGDWTQKMSIGVGRHHPSTVLLPDGQILVVCGHNPNGSQAPLLRRAIYIDPRTNFSRAVGTGLSYKIRGYHTISLLLPDGRVLVGGGRDAGVLSSQFIEKANIELLSPPYMFRLRPTLVTAPGVITAGEQFTVSGARGIGEVVLISLGSMTHSIDMNQRYVQLNVPNLPPGGQSGSFTETVDAPPVDGQVAPPGYYMLFVLGQGPNFTPSIAKIVQLQ